MIDAPTYLIKRSLRIVMSLPSPKSTIQREALTDMLIESTEAVKTLPPTTPERIQESEKLRELLTAYRDGGDNGVVELCASRVKA